MKEYLDKVIIPNVFQQEALVELDKTKAASGVVVMPTGTGKTFLAALWSKNNLTKNPKARILFMCHNDDINIQNQKEFQRCLHDMGIQYGRFNGHIKKVKQVTFATTQTLTRNLDKLQKDSFDYIIVDEAHHYQAQTFKKVVEHFTPKFRLGLTATPYRLDQKNIFKVVGDKIYEVKTSDAIKRGLLTKINYYCVDNDIDFTDIKWTGNNYDEKDLNKKICVKEYDDAILKEYRDAKDKYGRKKTICFCATVEHVYRMEKLFNDNGIPSVGLTCKSKAKTSSTYTSGIRKETRKRKVDDFRTGRYEIIFVRDLFNEGIDVPDADCVMMLRPTKSHTIFTQQIGRGLRTADGKDNCLILDFTGNAKRCVINFEVLGEMMELDIIKEAKKENAKSPRAPIIFVSNGCEVRLSKTKIEVLEDYTLYIGEYTKEQVINKYYRTKEELGRQPMWKETAISSHVYARLFGGYNAFLSLIGEPRMLHNKWTKEEVIDEYYKAKRRLGRRPRCKESGVHNSVYYKLFGDYNAFLESIGEPTSNKRASIDTYKKRYYRLKKDYGRAPTKKEFGLYIPRSLGGNYVAFLKTIGETDVLRTLSSAPVRLRGLHKDDFVKDYDRVKSLVGHTPTKKDITSHGTFPTWTYEKMFGDWANFLREVGVISNRRKITKEELIEEYYEIKKKLGRQPLCKEMYKHGHTQETYSKFFGTWNKFLAHIGEPILFNPYDNPTKDELIAEYYRVKESMGKQPTSTVFSRNKQSGAKYNLKKYVRVFGGWEEFLTAIGEPLNQNNVFAADVTEEDLIKNYYEVKTRLGRDITSEDIRILSGSKYGMGKYTSKFGSWVKFLERIEPARRLNVPLEELRDEVRRVRDTLGRLPTHGEFEKMGKVSTTNLRERFNASTWDDVLSACLGESEGILPKCNLEIISDYRPKTTLPPTDLGDHAPTHKSKKDYRWSSGGFKTEPAKVELRKKIVEEISDGDVVIMLESPELAALKEIEQQNKKPKSIVIPNSHEFDKVADALRSHKTDLNVTLVNTTALQYLADNPAPDFVWLDYCGGFTYYTTDLDVLLSKEFKDMKLVLTYNLFDPHKKDDSYYFANVFDYMLEKVNNNGHSFRLIKEVCSRYKKTMYSVGFNICLN